MNGLNIFCSFTLLTHGGMYEDLKQLLGREVDLVVDGSLRFPVSSDNTCYLNLLFSMKV